MSGGLKRRKLSNGHYEILSPDAQAVGDAITTTTVTTSQPNKPDQRRSLFVRSLPASVSTESLTAHFSQCFALKHATVVLDPATKISRGFGFVTFTDAEDAQAAVEKFNNSLLDGRRIRVEVAESRHREIEEDITGVRKDTKNLKAEELRAKRHQDLTASQPPKLIVRNLPWSIKNGDDLTKLFMSYGKVKHAVVPKGKNGQLAGFGFVILRGKKNAEKALEGVNGKEIDGRTLAVDWAVDKESWEKIQNEESKVEVEREGEVIRADSGVLEGNNTTTADLLVNSNGTSSGNESESPGEDEETDEEEAIMNGVALSVDDDEDSQTSEMDGPSANKLRTDQNSTTVFVRNLPFTADDDSLKAHFVEHHGAVRYARVVYDHETERSRGTGFVCFFNETDSKECVKNAPKHEPLSTSTQRNSTDSNYNERKRKHESVTHSVLQNESADPSGRYTMEGRVLQVSRALNKAEADSRMKESSLKRDHDKRRLYLLSEGTIPKGSKLYNLLGKAEIDIRESSARQRQKLVKTNPNLCLSLTRLSIRNIPRSITSKDLKALAREAVVGFARDVKEGKRQSLSKEELARSGDTDRFAERERKAKGKGIVKQIKIVFESEKTGSKVGEGKGGRSRGYGFIEYYGHRNALMGLRWLNGHLIKTTKTEEGERGKRLIVEFAIENAQVVQRRQDRENRTLRNGDARGPNQQDTSEHNPGNGNDTGKRRFSRGRPHEDGKIQNESPNKKRKSGKSDTEAKDVDEAEKNKIAMRNRIIAEKRKKRRMRKGKS